ncbi:Oxysterol-binding protein OBPa [Microsporum ferrugineum]
MDSPLLELGSRSSIDESSRPPTPGGEDEIVEPDQGNILYHIISQLRPGADLSRVVLPTFLLEPRSMLERITNFMAHPETLLPMPDIDDPLQRFVSVVKFYLSGWHIKPPGVKKPLNPILGETFTGYWEYPDGTRGYYIAEQTSHHPPKSSYFFMAPEHNIRIDGTLKPRSRFLGNSAASMMEGISYMEFMNRGKEKGHGERYIITQPNMYARGILFGKMKYELGDHSYVKCPENHFVADLEFKTRGYFSGTYNAIGGSIKNDETGEVYYELSGLWNGEMFIRDVTTGQKELLFNATHAKHTPPLTRPLEEQTSRESQKLWHNTVQALLERNQELATDEKTKIEDRQREEAAARAHENIEWRPKLFRAVHGGPGGSEEGRENLDWIINAHIDPHNPSKAVEQILAFTAILPGQKVNHDLDIPPQTPKTVKTNQVKDSLLDCDGSETVPGNVQHKPQPYEDLLGDSVNSHYESNNHAAVGAGAGMMTPLQPTVSSNNATQQKPIAKHDQNPGMGGLFDAEP